MKSMDPRRMDAAFSTYTIMIAFLRLLLLIFPVSVNYAWCSYFPREQIADFLGSPILYMLMTPNMQLLGIPKQEMTAHKEVLPYNAVVTRLS
ncbi:hypothetical protein CEXT_250761 [Caerostris extrusa]|uniref:Uncharacterized protein n=1 Tax=Caerostris extrusa TaxID=172846 RepID=A0AAV4PRC3_CAEEX|nr:hypothetical protein CEXT_250761 [Caerostris extrusa]